MSFQPPARRSTAAASAPAVGVMPALSGCGHLTSLGPDPAAAMPPPYHPRSPLVLQAMRVQQPTLAGGCPAGYVTLPGGPGGGGPGMCYRATGTPATFTSAAVSPVTAYQPKPPPGHPAAQTTTVYHFVITLPAAEVPALTAVTTTAHDAKGALAIGVADQTRTQGMVTAPFTGRQFEVSLPTRNQALQLQRILAPSSEGGAA